MENQTYLESASIYYRFFDGGNLQPGERFGVYHRFCHVDGTDEQTSIAFLGPETNILKLVNYWNRMISKDGWTYYV